MKVLRAAAAALLLVGAIGVAPVAAAGSPTCSDLAFLGIEVHGQHVVRDYVMGGELTEWPPKGGVVGAATAGGAALPGGPGPAFHFVIGVAPGASFCTDSNSPGVHP